METDSLKQKCVLFSATCDSCPMNGRRILSAFGFPDMLPTPNPTDKVQQLVNSFGLQQNKTWGKARRQQLLRVIIRRPSVSVVHRCRQVSLENIRLNRVWITMAIQGLISLSCGQPLVRVRPIHDVQWQVKSLFWLGSVWALQFICPAEWLKSHSGLSSAAWDSLRADG